MRLFFSILMSLALVFLADTKASAAEVKEWALLVFLNGHNNLDEFGSLNINQMETVGSNEDMHVVVQWASLKNATTKRLYIEKDSSKSKINSPVVQELPRVDMGDYRSLVEFVSWAAKEYPARHYFVDVWNHGDGWMRRSPETLRSISGDDLTGHSISTAQLGTALQQISREIGHPVDIFGADACLMSMVEVMAEISDSTETFVGSEETEPGSGWPYDRFLIEWNRKHPTSSHEIATILAKEYVASYQGNFLKPGDVTLSVIDLKYIENLRDSLGLLSNELSSLVSENRKELVAAVAGALSFEQHADYVDIGDLLKSVEKVSLSSAVNKEIMAVRDSLERAVVHNEVSKKYQRASGLSIWWPKKRDQYSKNIAHYSELKFSRRGGWKDLLHLLWNER